VTFGSDGRFELGFDERAALGFDVRAARGRVRGAGFFGAAETGGSGSFWAMITVSRGGVRRRSGSVKIP
jgi:hypothetical protein